MVEIFVTAEFEDRYQSLSAILQRKAEKQERVFRENPFHPSLHTEKLEPREREVWSFRIDRSLSRYISLSWRWQGFVFDRRPA